jgi:hypothetical protein
MLTPGPTITPPPSHTLSPIAIGLAYSQPRRRGSGSIGCVAVRICTRVAIWQRSPMTIGIEHHAVVVDERPGADRDRRAVVAPERRLDHDALADAPEQRAQQSIPLPVPPGRLCARRLEELDRVA